MPSKSGSASSAASPLFTVVPKWNSLQVAAWEVPVVCSVRNTAVVDYSAPGSSTDTKWVSIYGISNRVENCYFKGKTNSGTTLVVWLLADQTNLSNHHVIRRNYFGPRPDLGANGGETIRIGDSATSFTWSRTLVEENYFYRCNGETEIISNKSLDNTYRRNTFDSCEGALEWQNGDAGLLPSPCASSFPTSAPPP